jgi:hypothetical protein
MLLVLLFHRLIGWWSKGVMVEKTPRQIVIKALNLPTTHPKWQDYDRNWDNKTNIWEERNMIYTWYIKSLYFQLWIKENKLWYLWVWDAGFRPKSTKHLKGTMFPDGARSCCRTEIRPRQVPVMGLNTWRLVDENFAENLDEYGVFQ